METLYTIKEIVEITKTSSQTIIRKINSGELKAFKVGAQWRVTKEDLEYFIKGEKL